MDYKQHTIWLVLRLILILAVMMAIPLATSKVESSQLIFTYLVIVLVLAAQVLELVYFLNRTLRELTKFLDSIRNRDFNLHFNEQETRGSRKKLYKTFNEVLETYRDIRIEKEVHFRFLEHIIELIEIGILVFDQKGKVVLANTAAGNFTGVPSPRSWKHLIEKNPGLGKSVGSIESSTRILHEEGSKGESSPLAIQISKTRMLEQSYSLMAIQDIERMVEQKETGAWVRLLRTLNHEIKNSVTPISSLADTLMLILQNDQGQIKSIHDLDAQNLKDIVTSVETLQQRSNSLYAFIDEYNKLTRIPAPDPETISCKVLFEEILSFFKSELGKISLIIAPFPDEEDIEIRADRNLLDQVLINLIRNSMDALKESSQPEIILGCTHSGKEVTLTVTDNGIGIEKEILEDVFIPFFSTKSYGSGIGLSLVRHVLRLHGGNVRIQSKKGEGTTVSLILQKDLP